MKKFGNFKRCECDPVANFFRALGCKKRLMILEFLKKEELSVNEISEKLNIDKSVASRHLVFLREIGLISYTKKGLNVYYEISDRFIFDIINKISLFIKNNSNIK